MNVIKFCHDYFKKPEDGVLIQVFKTHFKELSDNFIVYDACFENAAGNNDLYQLPRTDLIVLVFLRRNNTLYTTVRRWTPEKEKYYRAKVGELFKVVRTDKKEAKEK